jgi:regulator of sigma E protease
VESFLFSLLPTLIVLGTLIFIHELGHFMACKCVGVAVERFSIGFGPEIFHFQYKETRVSLSIIPFGGFIKPKGESLEEGQPEDLDPDAYLSKGVGAKAFIVSAGVIMNFVLAFVLFVAIFIMGRPILQPVVGELVDGYPAKTAGILAGDRILSVDGKAVDDWSALTLAILTHPAGNIQLEVDRKGRVEFIDVEPRQEEVSAGGQGKQKVRRIGIKPSHEVEVVRTAPLPAIVEGGKAVWEFTALTYRVLWGLVTGQISFKNIAGPIGIMAITGETAKQGITSLLQLMALLSVNLAVINLLPIPALDGGHLFFLMVEAIRRKAVSQAFQERLTQVGFVFLMGLMVCIVFNDVQNFGIATKVKQMLGF